MHLIADRISPDEPAYGLQEGPYTVNGKRRWLQYVFVIRGDAIANHITDFGPAEDFKDIPPLLVPSYGDDSVAELQEMAERHRHDDRYVRRAREMLAESTLIRDVLRQEEMKIAGFANRSSFGAGGNYQRNGFPLRAVNEERKNRREERTNGNRHRK